MPVTEEPATKLTVHELAVAELPVTEGPLELPAIGLTVQELTVAELSDAEEPAKLPATELTFRESAAAELPVPEEPVELLSGDCVAIAGCAAMGSLGDAYDVSGCASVGPGVSCTVECATGYSGEATQWSCPADNTDGSTALTGTVPSCNPVVSCAALGDLGAPFDVSACASVAAGGQCDVSCAVGYTGAETSTYTCPSDNVDGSTEPAGSLPTCTATAGCAALSSQGDAYDVSGCSSLYAGHSCIVPCASGFTGSDSI